MPSTPAASPPSRPFIVGLGGTTRTGSTAERAITAALAHAASLGCDTAQFGAEALPTEPYDPTRPERSDKALAWVAAVRRAQGLVIATPSYHGGISGLVKNALDFIEDTRDDPLPYLAQRAVGCIVCADGVQAMGTTLVSLRSVVHALRGWPTPYGAALFASSRPFGHEGVAADPAAVSACQRVGAEVAGHAHMVLAAGPLGLPRDVVRD